MGEEFLGGVCGGKRWNPPQNMFSGSGSWSSLCSVAQLGGGGGGGSDVSGFIWPNEVVKGKPNNINNIEKYNSSFYDENSIIFPADMDSTFDTFFGFNSTSSDCHQINLLNGKDGGNDGNFGSILQDDMNPGLCYGMSSNNFSSNNNNSCNQGGSPPMALTASSNNSSSGDSSAITGEGGGGGGGLNTTNFDPITSSASYLIQTLFDDTDDSQLIKPNYNNNNNNNNNGAIDINSNEQLLSWAPITLQLHQDNVNQLVDGGMNVLINGGQGSNGGYANGDIALSSNIQASLLNSFNLHSRSRAPSSNQHRSHPSCAKHGAKVNSVQVRDSKGNVNEQTPAKRARIDTPSPMPTFKVRKEKLGDRITALQQLVSPFGKTDTASVLHEAIEYIKFLHDQVNALCSPYLKNGAAIQQQGCEKSNNEEAKQDLRSRGLCLVPISSTYPVAQETPVDFWTPTFGGTTYR